MTGRSTETGRLNITVRDGVDVIHQTYGDRKGSYFQGSVPDQDFTVHLYADSQKQWQLVLDNVQTGGRKLLRFSDEMYIGRTPAYSESQVKMVIPDDGSVSGNHCIIYEVSGRLAIMDMGSRNHTYLNGVQIRQPTEIQQWSEIRVGQSTFRVASIEKG